MAINEFNPQHRGRGGSRRPRLVAVQHRHAAVLRLRRHRQRHQPAADLRPAAPARRRPRPRAPPPWWTRPMPRRTMAPCRLRRWSSGSSSARPPTWARPPTTRAPGWSTRSRPCSWPSRSTATARRAARCSSNKTSLNATVNAGQPQLQRRRHQRGRHVPDRHPDGVRPPDDGLERHRHGQPELRRRRPTSTARGNTDSYAVHTFSGAGRGRQPERQHHLERPQVGGVAFETLFDPQGDVAAYSLLGANQSGFGHVEVHNPMAGTWTAVIFTVSNAPYFGPGPVLLLSPSSSTRLGRSRLVPHAQARADRHVHGEGHRRPGRRRGAQAAPGHRQQQRREHPGLLRVRSFRSARAAARSAAR